MKVEYRLGRTDAIAFNMFFIRHSPTVRRQRATAVVFGMIATTTIPAFFIFLVEGSWEAVEDFLWLLALLPIAFLVWYSLRINQWTQRSVGRMFNEGKREATDVDASLAIEEGGLRSTATEPELQSETLVKWSRIERVAVNDEYAFYFFSGVQAMILPRRAFDDPQEFQRFTDEVAARSGVAVESG